MGKLLGQIFKDDFKSIILWLFLPLASALIFMQLLSAFEGTPILTLAMGFSMTLLIIGPFLALAQAANNDRERFYGKNAGFYSSLPISSGSITGARLINYILLGIIIAISAFLNFLFLNIANVSGISLSEIFSSIVNGIKQIGAGKFTMAIVNLFMFGVFLVSTMMLANSFGSSSLFGKKSKYAPVIIFLILFFGLGMIGAKIQSSALADYVYQTYEMGGTEVGVSNDVSTRLMLIPLISNIVLCLGFYGLSYYFHDKKLSVD